MKNLLQMLPLSLILFSFSNCASGRKAQEEAPVEVKQAYYSNWSAEVRGADSGIALFVPVEAAKDVILDTIFFRGKKEALQKEVSEPNLYVAYFKIPSKENKPDDFVMHSDPRKEFGNKPPVVLRDFPFELAADEAMVQYSVNGEQGYFKIRGIKEKESGPIMRKKPENIRH